MATPLRNHGGKSVLALAAGRPGAVPGRRRLIIRPPAPPVNEKTAAGTRAPVGVAQPHLGDATLKPLGVALRLVCGFPPGVAVRVGDTSDYPAKLTLKRNLRRNGDPQVRALHGSRVVHRHYEGLPP